ncbi:MAG: hypothetical protein WBW31_09580 [Candidatus Sulfotelmatobacter sp.]
MSSVSILFQDIRTHAEECLQCERYWLRPISESFDRRPCPIGAGLLSQLVSAAATPRRPDPLDEASMGAGV